MAPRCGSTRPDSNRIPGQSAPRSIAPRPARSVGPGRPVLFPDAPEVGVQLLLKRVTIQPGEDIEFCTYFNLETPEMLAFEHSEVISDTVEIMRLRII